MLNFIKSIFQPLHLKICGVPGKVLAILLLTACIFTTGTFGQAGDLSQIRNGNGKVQNSVLDTCGTCWVNGNAGASNAHYVEGMSIAYRSLITGLTVNTCYEYELGYDTYHSAVAIDYLTHFQRLEPHQPFGHAAEVIDPTFFTSGSTQYHMHLVDAGPNTISIDPPAAGGVNSGTFNADGTARNDANQPLTSFNALPASERLFTIYNGTIENFEYIVQPTIVVGGADVETRVRIRFTAHSDSVVLAWGGHIASRLDWGYSKKQGKLVPLSAGGISGSPYHMRQKAFFSVDCGFDSAHVITSFSGFGNQDRSLSAAAVIPPPTCPTVNSDTICVGGTFDVFTISNPVAGTTYKWYFGSNTAGAKFSTNTDTVTGTSATVVPTGANFTPGSFSLNIKATLNSIDLTCTGVATGKVNPNPTADAGTAPTAQCAAVGGNTFSLSGSGTNGTCSWAVQSSTGTASGSFNSGQNTCTPSVKVTGVGTVTFRLTVTSNQTPSCGTATSDVTVTVNPNPTADAGSGSTQCAGANGNDFSLDGTATNGTCSWAVQSSTGTAVGSFNNNSQTSCDPSVHVTGVGTVTFRLTVTSNQSPSCGTATSDVTVTVNPNPTADAGSAPAAQCALANGNDFNLDGTATNGTCSWAVQSHTGTAAGSFNNNSQTSCDPSVHVTGSGTVTFRLTVTSNQNPSCGTATSDVTVTVNAQPATPSVTYNAPACDANTFSVTVNSPISGATYSIKDKCGATIPGVKANGVTGDSYTPNSNTSFDFSNIPAGSGFQVKVTLTGGCNATFSCGTCPSVTRRSAPTTEVAPEAPTVKAYPNPFSDKINFVVTTPVSGKCSLEVYDMMGQKVRTVYQGFISAGTQTFQMNSQKQQVANLIYVLRIDDKKITGRILQINQ